MSLEHEQTIAAVQAILFAAGEPLELSRIAAALELSQEEAGGVLTALQEQLQAAESGICLVHMDNVYQLCTKQDYADVVRQVLEIKRNTPLSAAAFEVLAVIAYHQPVTKAYVEQVRGVDCSGVIATLSQRGLIMEAGRLDLPGRPLLYGTTPEFLKVFCLQDLDELPELPPEKAEKEAEALQQLSLVQTAEAAE